MNISDDFCAIAYESGTEKTVRKIRTVLIV